MKKIYEMPSSCGHDSRELVEIYWDDPKSLLTVKKSNADKITAKIVRFLVEYTKKSGTNGYVIGLSGGIDSSIAAVLAAMAVGPERVHGMLIPSKFTSQSHIDDALLLAKLHGIEVNDYEVIRENFDATIDLTMLMTGVDKSHPNYKLLIGNNHARERMKILRGKAASLNCLVLGTTNLTEAWLGYATMAGDGYKGVDVEPIQRLPKTSEREYCRIVGIPEQIITKAPTAGLWENQTDETEIGMTYENIDLVMTGYMLGFEKTNIESITGIPLEAIEKIIKRHESNLFKALPEPFPELGF